MKQLMPKPPQAANQTAVLLLAHGTPDRLSEMAAYLGKVTGGRPMPAAVVEELQHRYAQIGLSDDEPGPQLEERPPLTRWTLRQAELLEDEVGTPVYVGMRNWHPFIADVVAQMRSDGVRHARVLCLAPQNSRTSTGLYRKALEAAIAATYKDNPVDAFTFDFIAGWSDEPLLAQAFAERLWPVWAEACAVASVAADRPTRVPILFTAHAVPCRTIMSAAAPSTPGGPGIASETVTDRNPPVPPDGIQNYGPATAPDPYPVECKQTAASVARVLAAVGMTDGDWFFAFQSQGIAGAPWIGPTVPDTLKALAAEGHQAVVVQPIGFLCDHVEILYDIDIDFKQQAAALGLQLSRAKSLNDSPTLIRALDHVLYGEMALSSSEDRAAG
jgi:ferrochelatase